MNVLDEEMEKVQSSMQTGQTCQLVVTSLKLSKPD